MKTVVVAFSTVALLTAGCSEHSDARAGRSPSVTPATGSGLVLHTTTSGGIAGLGGPGSLPDFSLYGDGRAITGGRPLTEYHLTPEALRRLVGAAEAAGLATPRTATAPHVSDAMYKDITFVTGGRPRTTRIVLMGGTDRVTRFLDRLDPARWPRTDLTADPRPYRPSSVAVLASPVAGTGPAWPFRPLVSGSPVGTRTCVVLTGADAGKVRRRAARTAQWSDHGRAYRVTLRPLLPDESGCADLT